MKAIVLGRLQPGKLNDTLQQVKSGDVYQFGVTPEDGRFTFRVTAINKPETWANISSREASELASRGGVYLVLWNPPGAHRNHRLGVFAIPTDQQQLFQGLSENDQYVKLVVKAEGDGYAAYLGGANRLVLDSDWVSEIELSSWEADWLRGFAPAKSQVTRAMQSQGYEKSAAVRNAIDRYAMVAATQFYSTPAFLVNDVHANQPYDLEVKEKATGKLAFRVEVKGTRSLGRKVLVTAGEVRAALTGKVPTKLFVLHSLKAVRSADGEITVTGGARNIVEHWKPIDSTLDALTYAHKVKQPKKF